MIPLLGQLEFDWAQWSVPLSAQWWQETTCSVLVGIACGVLGCFVVLRRMALIGDALSHAVLPGVVIAFMLTGSSGIAGLFLGALLAGLVTAGLIKLVSEYSRTKEDSAIGIVFTSLFAVGIILISSLSRGAHFDLKCFLFGDPLAVGPDDLLMMSVVAPLVLLVVFALYHRLKIASFDPVVAATMGISVSAIHYLLMGLLSATVVAGLKTTGVILVVAMVITPASAAYQLCNRLWSMLILAGVFGALSALAGMSLAFMTNSPTGPAMVLVATILFALAMLLSPNHGLIFRAWRRRSVRRHVDSEDCLKAVYHLGESGTSYGVREVVQRTGLATSRVQSMLSALRSERLVDWRNQVPILTPAGRRRAAELVRTHRLWESYLADEAGIGVENIHEEAERLEHAHELADEVDEKLGHPRRDPHGEVIPEKSKPHPRGPDSKMESAVQKMAAVWFLAVGLSHVLKPRAWAAFIIRLRSAGEAGALVCGTVCLTWGALIVGFHQVWHGIPIVLTLFGWAQIAKCLWYFLFPQASLRHMGRVSEDSRRLLLVPGVIFIAIGALLGYGVLVVE